MLTGDDIITHAQQILLDDDTQPGGGSVSWPEISTYFFARLRKLIKDKPDACVESEPHLLVAGVEQTAPASTVAILDIPRNTNVSSAMGAAITPTRIVDMDRAKPDWPTDTGTSVIHFMHDAKDPLRFYVWPAYSGGYVMLKRSYLPDYDTASEALPIGDEYEMALVYGVLAECYAKNTKRNDVAKHSQYEQLYANELGLKTTAQSAFAGGTEKDGADQ